MTLRTVLELIVGVILPVALTVVFEYIRKDNGLKNSVKFQIIVGVILGIASVCIKLINKTGCNANNSAQDE